MIQGGEIPSTRRLAFIAQIFACRHKQVVPRTVLPRIVKHHPISRNRPVVTPGEERKGVAAEAVVVQSRVIHSQQQGKLSIGCRNRKIIIFQFRIFNFYRPAFLLARCQFVAESQYLHIQFFMLERHLHTVVFLLAPALLHSAQTHVEPSQQSLGDRYA